MNIIFAVISVILILIWFICSGLNTKAAIDLGKHAKDSSALKNAYRSALVSAAVTWILVFLVLVVVALVVAGKIAMYTDGEGEVTDGVADVTKRLSGKFGHHTSKAIVAVMCVAIGAVCFTSGCSVWGAIEVTKSHSKDSKILNARKMLKISSSVSSVSFVVLVSSFIAYFVYKNHKHSKNNEKMNSMKMKKMRTKVPKKHETETDTDEDEEGEGVTNYASGLFKKGAGLVSQLLN